MNYFKRKLTPDLYEILMREMYSIDWQGTHITSRKLKALGLITGWDRLPAISKFKINLGKWHPMLKLEGIYKRSPNKLEFEDYKTKKSVRFMEYQLIRLRKLAQNKSPNY